MNSQSETMLDLLRELAMLKAQDQKSKRSGEDFRARQSRREEIAHQIRSLGGSAD